jgi:hypothetical protein
MASAIPPETPFAFWRQRSVGVLVVSRRTALDRDSVSQNKKVHGALCLELVCGSKTRWRPELPEPACRFK